MTGTRCRSRDTLVAVATLRRKLLQDWCRRTRRQAFPPRFLTLPLLANFLGHTKKYRWRRDGFQPWTCRRRRDKGIPGAGWRRWQLADSWPASICHRFRRWIRRAELAAPPLPHVPANGICRCHRPPLERRVGRARVIGQCAGHRKTWAVEIVGISLAVRPATQAHKEQGATCFSRRSQERGEGGACRPRSAKGPVSIGSWRGPESHVHPAGPVPTLYLWRRTRSWSWGRKVCSFFSVSWDSGSYLGLLSAVRRRSGLVWSGLVRSAGLCHPSPRVT